MDILRQRLIGLRQKEGLLQRDVADQLHIDRSTYSYYERGKTNPPLDILIKLANTIEKFRTSIEQSPQVLLRDSVTYRNACRFGVIAPTGRKVIFYFETLPGREDQK